MRRYVSRLGINLVYRSIAALFSLVIMAGAVAAQQGPPPGAGAPADASPRREMQDKQSREFHLRNAETQATAPAVNQKRLLEAIDQLKQDFKRIQLVRNEIVDNLMAKKPLDFKLISEQAEEINKRASRLKMYLMPPVPEDKAKELKTQIDYTGKEMEGALVRLCNLIYNFTQNPILKNPALVDVQQSAKAGSDLLRIIDFSDNIKRSAERLGKASN